MDKWSKNSANISGEIPRAYTTGRFTLDHTSVEPVEETKPWYWPTYQPLCTKASFAKIYVFII